MAKAKKIRAFQLASKLSMPFKVFSEHAKEFGVTFKSPQNSLSKKEGLALVEKIQQALAQQEAQEAEAAEVTEAVEAPVVEKVSAPAKKATKAKAETKKEVKAPVEAVQEEAPVEQVAAKASVEEAKAEKAEVEPAKVAESAPVKGEANGTNGHHSGTTLHFALHHAHTMPGDTIYVVGELPELGGWQPEQGVALDPTSWPEWKATVPIKSKPEGTFEFKFVIKNAHGLFWEKGGNRLFQATDEANVIESRFR